LQLKNRASSSFCTGINEQINYQIPESVLNAANQTRIRILIPNEDGNNSTSSDIQPVS